MKFLRELVGPVTFSIAVVLMFPIVLYYTGMWWRYWLK